ncbi:raffinose synthase or seed imbibition protein Sip1-domain-containing protein [Lipomyces japonicus]|uniref:raffinose synthase or seed imbibition protein Sip1-domain-containing protein n=1 Tax=Lipomyces japonicus TaxID=56871 RepID=UPI0034CD703D
MDVHAISLYPPLSTVTAAKSRILHFHAFVTTKIGAVLHPEFAFELWWATNNEDWIATPLLPIQQLVPLASSSSEQHSVSQFSIKFVPPLTASVLEFTARYRLKPNRDWEWCGNNDTNGRVLLYSVQSALTYPFFNELFTGTSDTLEPTELQSEVPDSKVYKVVGIIAPQTASPTAVALGKPNNLEQFLALVRISGSWMGPRHGKQVFRIDRPGVMVLFQRTDGQHVSIIPLSNMKTLVTGHLSSKNGQIIINFTNDSSDHRTYSVLIGISRDPQKAVQSALYSLRSVIQTYSGVVGPAFAQDVPAILNPEHVVAGSAVHPVVNANAPFEEPIHGTWYEEWIDLFGYCTWNSMGLDVTHNKVINALQDFHDKGIRIGLFVLDDGWMDVNQFRQLKSFEASSNFPQGLKFLIDTIRQKFPYIKHIAVWHALLGYWNGIDPDSILGKKYELVKGKGYGNETWIVSERDVGQFYHDFYAYLASAGVTAIKADVQMQIYDLKGDFIDGTYICKAYQDALRLQSLRFFYRRVMYSMAMSGPYFYYSLLQLSSPKPTLRNSDDFFPEISNSHHWHIYCNSMNSILTSLLHAIPDWDMFTTTIAKYSTLHAVSRCFSGGPVYITDTPGYYNLDIINEIQALTIRGTSVVLRPSRTALTLDPYFDITNKRLMFLTNFFGGTGGFGLLAAFNVSEDHADIFVKPVTISMVPGLVKGRDYVFRSHRTGQIVEFSNPVEDTAEDQTLMIVKLAASEWDVFTAAPLATAVTLFKTIRLGAIGLVDKVTGAAGIERQQLTVPETGRVILDVDVKALGMLGVYISGLDQVQQDAAQNLLITIQGEVLPYSALSTEKNLLKIDLIKAWNELGLSSRWSNEISLRIYVT